MATFSEADQSLVEEIKKVKVEKRKVPDRFDLYVQKRQMDYSICSMGHEAMVLFFEAIGEGSFYFPSWFGVQRVRKAAIAAGYSMMRNKRSGRYAIFKKGKQESDVLSFDTNLLMPGEVEEEAPAKA